MRRFALIVSLLALSSAPALAATGTVRMDDGVRLHYTLVEPPGQAPSGGRPGLLLMHGLGGSDAQMAPAARYFARRGYAALAFSVRGEGASGGTFGLVGPRDVADLEAMVAWFERRPAVSARIGCFGVSLGGGECWAGTAAGLFDAVVPVATWTDLATALWPGGVARSGVLLALGGSLPASSTLVQRFGAAGGTLTPALAAALRERSVAPRLAQIRTPAFLVQGRVDFVFDVDQAATAFARLRGPKKLYVGDFGHPPATFASPDFPGYVLAQSTRWFDRYLRGRRNGVERPAVAVADRTGRRRAPFAGLPSGRVLHLAAASRAPAAVETFGDSVVRVNVTRLARYPRLVAVVLANGRVVTHGAVVPRRGANTIHLADYVVPIPKGARLQVRLGRDGGAVDPAYFSPAGGGGTIRFGKVTLDLSVLARPVSR